MPAVRPRIDSISLQDRDNALLRGLFESRVMTSKHVATLYFEGRAEAAKKRLQKLKTAGFVKERPRRAYEPSLLFLTSSLLSHPTSSFATTLFYGLHTWYVGASARYDFTFSA